MARNDRLVEVDGADIKRRREALGMTRDALAAEAGITGNTLLATEHHYRQPSERTARKILEALNRLEADRGPDEPPPAGPAAASMAERVEELTALLGELSRVVVENVPNVEPAAWSDGLQRAAYGGAMSKIRPLGPRTSTRPVTGSFDPDEPAAP